MNPTFPQATIDAALERDPVSAASEYLAEFRTDVQAFVSREAVEQCVARGVFERAPIENVRYMAFVDPSGGSSDSMTLAVGHRENKDVFVLDCVRERRSPFSPEAVVAEFVTMIKRYRVGMVRGDRYAGEWPREQFKKLGVEYYSADKAKSDLYLAALPMIMSGKVDLLDNQHLTSQFCGLERRTGRGGRDSVDHRPGAHEDLANAVAGLIYTLLRVSLADDAAIGGWVGSARRQYVGITPGYVGGGSVAPHLDVYKRGWLLDRAKEKHRTAEGDDPAARRAGKPHHLGLDGALVDQPPMYSASPPRFRDNLTELTRKLAPGY
jgi:hypothetical protein